MDLFPGIYEQLINKFISEGLSSSNFLCQKAKLDAAESSKILSTYLSNILEKVFTQLQEKDTSLERQVTLANEILAFVQDKTQVDIDTFRIEEHAEQLFALIEPQNNIQSLSSKPCLIRPETSLAQSSLFTGAPKEPQLFSELKKEILSCNRIDMLVSFIKWTGLRMIFDELKLFTAKGGKLRIITTSYMGATDIKAIEYLSSLPNTEIKVSYDTKQTRLHAKAYIFVRDTGFTTAYIGSSNLSNSALSTGLEWNIKVTKQDLPETIKKVSATFETYWNSSRFENYSPDRRDYLAHALQKERGTLTDSKINFTFDITPYPYQQDILHKIDAERSIRGNFKNLIVAATGTGKTVISALDYKIFCKATKSQPKLLFIAHREEILKQSLACFRTVLKDSNFGELFVGTHRPTQLDHLFMSIQNGSETS